MFFYWRTHKKSAGNDSHHLSRIQGSGIAHLPRISNAEAHAKKYIREKYTRHEHWTLPYLAEDFEFTRFCMPQIRRWLNAFLHVYCPPTTRLDFGTNNAAKSQLFHDFFGRYNDEDFLKKEKIMSN